MVLGPVIHNEFTLLFLCFTKMFLLKIHDFCMTMNLHDFELWSVSHDFVVPRGPGKISLGFRVPTQELHGELWGSREMDRKCQQHCTCRSGWCFTGFGVSWSWKTLWQGGEKSWRALRGDDFLVCFFLWFWCVLVFFCNLGMISYELFNYPNRIVDDWTPQWSIEVTAYNPNKCLVMLAFAFHLG